LSRLPERRVIHNCKTIHVSSAETRLINEQWRNWYQTKADKNYIS
jgi:hypothetical protein